SALVAALACASLLAMTPCLAAESAATQGGTKSPSAAPAKVAAKAAKPVAKKGAPRGPIERWALLSRSSRSFRAPAVLSATPHNGHSNSFATLLELLDPYRFTRGVKVRGKRALDDVMVCRQLAELNRGQPRTGPAANAGRTDRPRICNDQHRRFMSSRAIT